MKMMITIALEEEAGVNVTADALVWADKVVPVLQADVAEAAVIGK
jgi:hypothetical protein